MPVIKNIEQVLGSEIKPQQEKETKEPETPQNPQIASAKIET